MKPFEFSEEASNTQFKIANETATEENKRLAKVPRKTLVSCLEKTLNRVKKRKKSLPIEFLVQTRPFSTNKMSGVRKTYETKNYIAFRDLIAKSAGGTYGITGKERFSLVLVAAFSNKRGDLDNPFKPLLDSIVACVDDSFDDSQVYQIIARKRLVPKGFEYLQVRLDIIDDDEYKSWW